MLKKLTAILLLLLGVQLSLSAQSLVIIGNVEDQTSEEPIGFCNVALVSAQDEAKILTGTTTNEQGSFVLKLKTKEECYFRASFVGYEDIHFLINPADILDKGQDTVFLYNLKMNPTSQDLETVTVVGKVKRYEMNADRLVMNVDEATTATVISAFDLLRKVPGVAIDKDENLTLNGQSGVLFQLNGRDMRLGWDALKTMLKGMNPQSVERFEVITHPSAKYDAEGTSGIINIRTKKNQNKGFNCSVNAGAYYESDLSLMGGVNLNYVSDKWTTTFNYNRSKWQSGVGVASDRMTFQGGDTVRFYSPEAKYPWAMEADDFNLSIDYLIDENNSIGIYSSYAQSSEPDTEYPVWGYVSQSPNLDKPLQSILTTNSQHSGAKNLVLGTTYLHSFDTLGTKLQFDLSATLSSRFVISKAQSDYFNAPNDSLFKQEALNNHTDNSCNSYAAKVDFQKPTVKYGTFEAGAKAMFTRLDNDFTRHQTGEADLRNNFLFAEDILAAYLSYSKPLGKKTSLRAGVRFEYTQTEGELVGSDSVTQRDYADLFPNISLNHSFNQFNSLSLSYNYRISRPSYEQLNPFLQKLSDYSYKGGNPLLKPQYAHTIGLDYSLFYMAFFSLSYGYGSDFVSNILIPYGQNGAVLEQPGNVATSQNLNLGLSLVAPITKWLDVNFYGQVNYTNVVSEQKGAELEIDNTSYMMFAAANFTLPYKIKLSLSGYLSSSGLWTIYRYGGMHSFNVGLSKTFLKDDKLNVSLNVNNIRFNNDMTVEAVTDGLYMLNTNHMQGPMFSINLRYNFGKMYQSKNPSKIKTDDMDQRTKGGMQGGGAMER